MNRLKLLLVSSCAITVMATGALAADLPSKKAAPVQYVKICDAYGAGFFWIPGTDTCLRVGGYVRAVYEYMPGRAIRSVATGAVTQVAGDQDTWGMQIRGRVDLDARTSSPWGTVQTVVLLRGQNTEGLTNTGSGWSNFATSLGPAANGSTGMSMERAFIRFAGLTAGVATENFTAMPGTYFGNMWASFSSGVKQLAYTATFGSGFSATIALESRGDFPFNGGTTLANPGQANTQPGNGLQFVGNIHAEQSWGFVHLAGAVGNNSISTNVLSGGSNLLSGNTNYQAWALGATVKFNLPMIAAGDAFYLNASYARGMLGLIMVNNTSAVDSSANGRLFGGILRQDSNLVQVAGAGTAASPAVLGTTNAWQAGAYFTHYWTPSWRSNLAAGYVRIEPPNVATGYTTTTLGAATIWGVQGNLIWSPVKAFDIGVELQYGQIKQSIQNPAAAFVAAGQPGLSDNNMGVKLRLDRTF